MLGSLPIPLTFANNQVLRSNAKTESLHDLKSQKNPNQQVGLDTSGVWLLFLKLTNPEGYPRSQNKQKVLAALLRNGRFLNARFSSGEE